MKIWAEKSFDKDIDKIEDKKLLKKLRTFISMVENAEGIHEILNTSMEEKYIKRDFTKRFFGGAFMSYKGIVKGNVVILEKNAKLSDGMQVMVISEKELEKKIDFDADPFLHVDEWLPFPSEDIPKDLAHQHNHYLYGIEKQ